MSCVHCQANVNVVKMKRGYYHYVAYRLVRCTDRELAPLCEPIEPAILWTPRRLRKQAAIKKDTPL